MISKHTQKALSYFFAILVVVLGSIILVAIAQGYRYDFLTGQVKESGLVLVDSQPNNADIYINGKRSKYRTPLRLADVNLGPMTVELVKPDYRVWKKSFLVQGQEVNFADYALLLPQKLKYGSYLPDYKVTGMAQTLDRRRTLIVTSKPTAAIWAIDNNQAPSLYYQAPTDSGEVSLEGLQMSRDGNAAVITQKLGSQVSLLALSGSSSPSSTDLTTQFQITSGSLSYSPDNNQDLYWLDSNSSLRKINLDSKTVSAVLADNVASLQLEASRGFFVTKITDTTPLPEVWTFELNSVRNTKLNISLAPSATYKIDLTRARTGSYLAILARDAKQLTVVTNYLDSKPATGILSKSCTDFSLSLNGGYISYNVDNTMRSYDVELAERANVGVSLRGLQDWRWLDPEHLIVLANNQLRLMDYDGQNDQTISDVGDNVSSFAISPNSKSITYISSAGVRTVSLLQR